MDDCGEGTLLKLKPSSWSCVTIPVDQLFLKLLRAASLTPTTNPRSVAEILLPLSDARFELQQVIFIYMVTDVAAV